MAMYVGIGKFNKERGRSPTNSTPPAHGTIGDLMAEVPVYEGAKPAFGPEALPPELREKLRHGGNG